VAATQEICGWRSSSSGRVVSKDLLIDALWGERPPQSAPVAMYGLVSALHRLLEPHHADASSAAIPLAPLPTVIV
jgi:DNA-binding winged helix-turn-helix (wHTH) protein